MTSEIYSSRIIELASEIENAGSFEQLPLENYGKSSKYSKLCGSKVDVELILDETKNQVKEFKIMPKACALGQASASILSQNIIGAKIDEIKTARDGLFSMLKENSCPPEGRFWELRYLEPVADYTPRHASVMLAWDAALEAIEIAKK